jgi:hypothetical protein
MGAVDLLRGAAKAAGVLRDNLVGAAEAQGNLTNAAVDFAKASLQVAPPSVPLLVGPTGLPISGSRSVSSSGAGGGSGGGSRLVTGEQQHGTPPDSPGGYLGEVRGGWRWGWLGNGYGWSPVPGAASSQGSGGGGGDGTGGGRQGMQYSYVGAFGAGGGGQYAGAATGTTSPTGGGKSLSAGEAVIAGELRGLRQDIRNLSRDDNGAQLRRRGEL